MRVERARLARKAQGLERILHTCLQLQQRRAPIRTQPIDARAPQMRKAARTRQPDLEARQAMGRGTQRSLNGRGMLLRYFTQKFQRDVQRVSLYPAHVGCGLLHGQGGIHDGTLDTVRKVYGNEESHGQQDGVSGSAALNTLPALVTCATASIARSTCSSVVHQPVDSRTAPER